jgi:cephalosporin hydroxylase
MSTGRVIALCVVCLAVGAVGGSMAVTHWAVEAPPSVVAPPAPRPPPVLNASDAYQAAVYASLEWDKLTWLGVHAQQNPNDVWSYQQIFTEVKPDLVIEAGTNDGGGALVWATLLNIINPAARVVTIDIEEHLAAARQVPLFQEKVDFVLGSSTSAAVVDPLRKRSAGKKVIAILDSDHRKAHVLEEINLYGDLVSLGSYLLVQDTNVNGHPAAPDFGPGPWEAVEEFIANGGKTPGGAVYEVDRSRELFGFSMHPRGYLKRIK